MQRAQNNKSRSIIWLGLILVLFLVGVGVMLSRCYFISPDSAYLLSVGKNVVTGHGITINGNPHTKYPPAYGTAAGILYLLIGNLEAAGHLASVISGFLAIILVFIYTKRAYDEKTALIACLLLAIIPLFTWISSIAVAEAFYALWYAAFVLMILNLLNKPSLIFSLIAGIVASVAYLTRAEGFLLLPLGFFTLLISWLRGKHKAVSIIFSLALFIIGWAILAFPYLFFLRENLGGWTLSGKITYNIERVSEAVYIDDYGSMLEKPLAEYESPGLVAYLVENFPRVMMRYFSFAFETISTGIRRAGPLIALFLWFIFLALSDRTKRGWHFLLLASPLLVYPLAHIETRYLTPTLVTLVPPIAWGMKLAWDRNPKKSPDRFMNLRRSLVVLSFAARVIGNGLFVQRMLPPPIETRVMAEWMVENLPDAQTAFISARFGYVNFYLENEKFRYFPYAENLDESIRIARDEGITYLVIDKRLPSRAKILFGPLLDPSNAPPGLEFVKKFEPPEVPNPIVLYRILPAEK
ncbi:MAG: glycosyltransferase family 39 protein [bacterium]